MVYHVYYATSDVYTKDIDIPSECLTDMKAIQDYLIHEIAKDPKGGKMLDRDGIVKPENTISINAIERDGVFFGF